MQRILALSYLLVWTWYEHVEAARLLGCAPVRHLLLLIDEVESHLHPEWQRTILPTLLDVQQDLADELSVQIIANSHEPMVLASLEPFFAVDRDQLLSFQLADGTVTVSELPWARQGDVVGWLTSEAFGLKQARSREAERAIQAALALERGETDALPEDLDLVEAIHHELLRVVATESISPVLLCQSQKTSQRTGHDEPRRQIQDDAGSQGRETGAPEDQADGQPDAQQRPGCKAVGHGTNHRLGE